MSPEENLKKNNINLPKASDPVGSYLSCKKSGNFLFISGQISIDEKNTLIKVNLGKTLLQTKDTKLQNDVHYH